MSALRMVVSKTKMPKRAKKIDGVCGSPQREKRMCNWEIAIIAEASRPIARENQRLPNTYVTAIDNIPKKAVNK